MPAAKRPTPNATLGDMQLDAEWSVVKKHTDDPDTTAWPRLTIISNQQMQTSYKVDLSQRGFTTEFDMKRHGVWLFLAELDKVGPKAAKKINFKSKGANQPRFDFNTMAGLFRGMSTEKHNVKVEVWHDFDGAVSYFWIFAPIIHVRSTGQYFGTRIIDEK